MDESEREVKESETEVEESERGVDVEKEAVRLSVKVEKSEREVDIEKQAIRLSGMKNKLRRVEAYKKLKRLKKAERKKRQDERKKESEALGEEAPPKLVPRTIENTREYDETTVKDTPTEETTTNDDENAEVQWDILNDEFKTYFDKSYVPKVIITSGDNPHTRTITFMKELSRMIPNAELFWRNRSAMKKMIEDGKERGYTDVVVINENNRKPNGMVVSHLPDGPTAHFKLSNVKATKEMKKNWRNITSHRPEVILNNFTTRLGHSIGRMLASLFHYEPEFRGQRAVTFHNQRDYMFFRHHRYEFKNSEKVKLKELGPRFTLKLRSLQKGTFDSKLGEYEWMITGRRHEMETSRRRFFL
uniref:Ribosome production factor 1 n=1 Tax=Lepeophtheirus salmonis TaxID=72036 RepID=C1BS24_LEPSM|nr:Ribosome production factor 1 [Lepeophtheirus salmonis]